MTKKLHLEKNKQYFGNSPQGSMHKQILNANRRASAKQRVFSFYCSYLIFILDAFIIIFLVFKSICHFIFDTYIYVSLHFIFWQNEQWANSILLTSYFPGYASAQLCHRGICRTWGEKGAANLPAHTRAYWSFQSGSRVHQCPKYPPIKPRLFESR